MVDIYSSYSKNQNSNIESSYDSSISWITEKGNKVSLSESDDPWYISKKNNLQSENKKRQGMHCENKLENFTNTRFDLRSLICILILILLLFVIIRAY
jgi:hypothetical protein